MCASVPSFRFHSDAVQFKKLILKLRWIGRKEDADRLLRDLGGSVSSEMIPVSVSKIDQFRS